MPAKTLPPSRTMSGRRELILSLTRFLAVGTAGLACDVLVFTILTQQAGVAEAFARALSLGAATGLTWRLNRRFTFGDSARVEAFEGGWYGVVALAAQGLNYVVFLVLRVLFPILPPLAAILCGAATAALFSYTGQRFITFRGRVRS